MKLSKSQTSALFDLIKKELNSDINKRVREIKKQNKSMIEQSIIDFKKTDEYKAVMLLAKKFPKTNIDWSIKERIEILAHWTIKPKIASTFISVYDERTTIDLLAVDCKNLVELKQKINNHYKLKNRI